MVAARVVAIKVCVQMTVDAEASQESPAAESSVERRCIERRCIVSGQVRPATELIRFVLGPGDVVFPDPQEKLPGRGFWLSVGRDVVETARKKKLFAKAARHNVIVPEDLAERLDLMLARRCLDFLGLARRAGLVVGGYEKVYAALKSRQVAILFEASDGAVGGRDKLCRIGPGVRVVDMFGSTDLGEALGRDAQVHVAVKTGHLASKLWQETERLGRYRGRAMVGCAPDSAEERQS